MESRYTRNLYTFQMGCRDIYPDFRIVDTPVYLSLHNEHTITYFHLQVFQQFFVSCDFYRIAVTLCEVNLGNSTTLYLIESFKPIGLAHRLATPSRCRRFCSTQAPLSAIAYKIG